MSKKILYKILGVRKQSISGGQCSWKLNKWTVKKRVKPCKSGYHLVEMKHIYRWIPSWDTYEIWEAQGKGEFINAEDKIVFEQARIVRKVISYSEAIKLRYEESLFSFIARERKNYLARKRRMKIKKSK